MLVNTSAPSTLQQKNKSDYLSVASAGYTIDLEQHDNLLPVWGIDQAVGMFLIYFCLV